ncbi:hypothetical protein VNO78_27445 [Psophocarpus tetragonolobus]|uniref:Endonuclease/exonuclease/phosphatase domain-containing protein n=1 Tax=Psophocarpus tetragonolobus TaxID=3891 RepID=A0AAN9S163_PSOTE
MLRQKKQNGYARIEKISSFLLTILPAQDTMPNDFRVLAWNIRGAMGRAGKNYRCELVLKHKPSLIILLETDCPYSKVKSFWDSLAYHSCAISEAICHSQEIWVLLESHTISTLRSLAIFRYFKQLYEFFLDCFDDFNEVAFPCETRGGQFIHHRVLKFQQMDD